MNKKDKSNDDRLKFLREFLLQNFKNTQDIRFQYVEFLNRIRAWFVTVWIAEISFLSASQISLPQMYIILYATIFLFYLMNIGWRYRKEDISRIIGQFEIYLMTATDEQILEMKGPLMTIYEPPVNTEKRKLIIKAATSLIDNDVFCYTMVLSSFFPILIKKSVFVVNKIIW